MKIFIIVALFVLALVSSSKARTMDRCSLAREMDGLGVPRDQLARWTCIAEHESSYRTDAIGKANTDGSWDYGILQINDLYWCQTDGKPSSNGCGLNCNELLVDDITKSVRCAQKVLGEQGWSAWTTLKYCEGDLPSIEPCFN